MNSQVGDEASQEDDEVILPPTKVIVRLNRPHSRSTSPMPYMDERDVEEIKYIADIDIGIRNDSENEDTEEVDDGAPSPGLQKSREKGVVLENVVSQLGSRIIESSFEQVSNPNPPSPSSLCSPGDQTGIESTPVQIWNDFDTDDAVSVLSGGGADVGSGSAADVFPLIAGALTESESSQLSKPMSNSPNLKPVIPTSIISKQHPISASLSAKLNAKTINSNSYQGKSGASLPEPGSSQIEDPSFPDAVASTIPVLPVQLSVDDHVFTITSTDLNLACLSNDDETESGDESDAEKHSGVQSAGQFSTDDAEESMQMENLCPLREIVAVKSRASDASLVDPADVCIKSEPSSPAQKHSGVQSAGQSSTDDAEESMQMENLCPSREIVAVKSRESDASLVDPADICIKSEPSNPASSETDTAEETVPNFDSPFPTDACHECVVCRMKFATPFLLDDHEGKVHGIKKIYDCIDCPYWSESVQDLQHHLGVHAALKGKPVPFHCMDCWDIFLIKNNLVTHTCHVYKHATLIQVFKNDEATAVPSRADTSTSMYSSCLPLTCRLCDTKFDALFLLDHHYRSYHKLEKSYNCEECLYHANTYREMDRHERVHKMLSGRKVPFLCQVCRDIFTHPQVFERHIIQDHSLPPGMLFHTKVPPGGNLPGFISTEKATVLPTSSGGRKRVKNSVSSPPMKPPIVTRELCCAVCNVVYTTPSDLDLHYTDVHKMSKPYGCRHCTYRTGVYNDLEKHVIDHFTHTNLKIVDHANQKRLRTKKTNAQAQNPDKRMPPNPDIFSCGLCPEKFITEANLNAHVKTIHNEKSLNCAQCTYQCADETEMKQHMIFHEYYYRKEHFQCQECHLLFNVSTDFERHHLEVHQVAKPYKCETCGFQCGKAALFKGHTKRHTKPFACEICGHRFAENCDLRVHLISHQAEMPFKCKECPKAFKIERLLTVHARLHTNERPYPCKLCEKKYYSQPSLASHMKAKHGNGPGYMCEICGKAYPTSGHLARHKRSHSEDMPYQCDICPKAFKRMEHLKCHLRTHTGEKPYECKECGKRFKQICGLHAHQKVHTGEKPYVCKVCEKAFTYSSSIKDGACTRCRSPVQKRKVKISSRKKRRRDWEYDSEDSTDASDYDNPFGCNQCDKRYKNQTELDTHKMTHKVTEDGTLHSERDVLGSLMFQA